MKLEDAHIRDLLDSGPDATVIVDQVGRIVFANIQVRKIFGYEPDELVGSPVEILMPEQFNALHRSHRAAFVRAPEVRHMGTGLGLSGLHKDGTEFPIEVSLSPVNTDQGLLISSAIRDISNHVEIESALNNARQIAERATITKSRFLAAASHDLRQPLQSISIYVDVLNRVIRDKPDKALEVTGKIDKSLAVMGELLDALLDISMLDSGSIEPEKQDFDLQSVLDQLEADNAPSAIEKGLSLTIEPCDESVRTDPSLLLRILENFVTNAIRYTDSGSVSVVTESDEGHLRIKVTDTGIGIPEDSIDTIFEEYFQLDNPVRDRRKGLGLGLSIVKHIAELLGNPLSVTSTIGEGSTFSVSVPIGEPIVADMPTALPKAAGIHVKDPVILFVDDDPAIVDATTMMLDLAGFKVEAVLDGSAAIELMESGFKPDMLATDFRLPGANGVDVVKRARELFGEELPTILMTGDTSAKTIENAKLRNCIVLHKPVDTDHLIELIESSLSPQQPAA